MGNGKVGRKVGDIRNTKGNLLGLGDGSTAYQKQLKSRKGFYYISLQKRYRGVSELDVELREDYALDLLETHLRTPRDFLRLVEKKENLTETSLDTVYYVYQGVIVLGKMAISVRRYGSLRELLFIYSEKRTAPKRGIPRKRASAYKNTSQAKSMKNQKQRKRVSSEKRTT